MIVKVTKSTCVNGNVDISGAKNSALPILCAALIFKKTVVLENIPLINDIIVLTELLKKLGVRIKEEGNTYTVKAGRIKNQVLMEEVSLIRGSYYLMGALLTRYKSIKINYPGGCNLGSRPIDFHFQAFEQLGFKVVLEPAYIYIKEIKRQASVITFPKKSVGATINTIMLATSISGITSITNPSLEPEVLDVIDFLNKSGCRVIINDDETISITKGNQTNSCSHSIISDRIEAGSFLFLAASHPNSNLTINNVEPRHLETVIEVARKMGVSVEVGAKFLIVKGSTIVKSIDIEISEYPSFPTDLQPILSIFMLKTEKSTIKDYIFPKRISQIDEIKKMNGRMECSDGVITVYRSNLEQSIVEAKDLRNAMALVIAGTMATGTTYIDNIQVLLRGYEDIINKLQKIGVSINFVDI